MSFPEGWELKRLKHLTPDERQIMYGIVLPGPNVDDGVPIVKSGDCRPERLRLDQLHRTTREIEAPYARARLKPGDLVYAIRGSVGMVAMVPAELEGANLTQDAARIAPRRGIDSRWLYYAVQSHFVWEQLERGILGATVKGINIRDLKRPWVPLPPPETQRAIADFLDRKTAAIDALIEKKERLIALLQEKRQALITQAVTKGLDPSVPMKDSGIEWLGEVPAHWEVMPLRRLLRRIEQGWSPQCENVMANAGEWGVLRAGCTAGGVFRETEQKALPAGISPRHELEVREGDLLVSRASGSPSIVGSAAIVTATAARLMLSDKVFRLRLNQRADAKFLAFALGSSTARRQIETSLSGAEGLANNLPQSELRSVRIPVPPVGEQCAVATELSRRVRRLDEAIRAAQRSVDKLSEYRQALITAAVTGQIDVTKEAA